MAVRSGVAAPDALAEPLLRWLEEQRDVTLVTLPLAQAPEPAAPEEAQLRRFHENNADRFSSPEYREATVAVLTADLLSREVEVTEAEIAAAYEARRGQFETPEGAAWPRPWCRTRPRRGRSPPPGPVAPISRRWPPRPRPPAARRSSSARSSAPACRCRNWPRPPSRTEGSVTAPVQSPFGWHVFKVEKVEPGQKRPLTEMHDQLKRDLAQEKAADIAFERANKVEDALAGGASLAEVAKQFGLGLANIRADAAGLDAEGKPVELPVIEAARAPLMKAIFAAERGTAPRLQETEAGFVAVEIKDITPPALRPFETVEPAVRAAWEADAKRREQETRAAGLLAATKEGKPLAEAAGAAGLGSREVGAVRATLSRAPRCRRSCWRRCSS